MHGLHWPDAVLSYVVAALAIGFPIVVSLAWIFDVNAGRIERTAPAPNGLRGVRLGVLLGFIGLLAAAPGVLWYFVFRARAATGDAASRAALDAVPPASEIRAVPSIAVLPLVNLSRDPDQEYFSDGLADEILNTLAQVDGLRVAGRTSSFSFKGKNEDLRSIGQKLGVGAVLEGSVRRQGDRVRITAQLINVADGFHLWSQNFDRNLQDIFAVQEEIAKAVVEGLKVKLIPGKAPMMMERRTANMEAYDQYLVGMQILNHYVREDVPRAKKALERAVALDPAYAPAWSGLSMANALLSDFERDRAEQSDLQEKALAAANKAVEIAPDLAETWTRRGLWRMQMGWDWRGAEEDINRALALNPGDVASNDARARLYAVLGQMPGAIAAALKTTELDRLNYPEWIRLFHDYAGSGQLAEARNVLEKAEAIAPDASYVIAARGLLNLLEGRPAESLALAARVGALDEDTQYMILAPAYHLLGRAVEAQQALDAFIAKFADFDAYQIAEIHAWRGDKDRAFEWLDRSYRQHDGGFVAVLPNNCSLKCNPKLRSLRSDPRYAAFLKKMNLPPD
jgi:serine/threonine-protein kinase